MLFVCSAESEIGYLIGKNAPAEVECDTFYNMCKDKNKQADKGTKFYFQHLSRDVELESSAVNHREFSCMLKKNTD